MAKLKAGGVIIDTVELKERYLQIAEDTRKDIADLATVSLQGIIDAINEASALRLSQAGIRSPSSGTLDKPLEGAKVIVKTRKSRVTVSVLHQSPDGKNVFDILDAGTKARAAPASFSFPRYAGHTTPPSNAEVGDPTKVRSIIASGNVAFVRNQDGEVDMAWRRKGQTIAGIPSRDFYKHTGAWVLSQLVERRITTQFRRSRLRIKKTDIVITFRKGKGGTD